MRIRGQSDTNHTPILVNYCLLLQILQALQVIDERGIFQYA